MTTPHTAVAWRWPTDPPVERNAVPGTIVPSGARIERGDYRKGDDSGPAYGFACYRGDGIEAQLEVILSGSNAYPFFGPTGRRRHTRTLNIIVGRFTWKIEYWRGPWIEHAPAA